MEPQHETKVNIEVKEPGGKYDNLTTDFPPGTLVELLSGEVVKVTTAGLFSLSSNNSTWTTPSVNDHGFPCRKLPAGTVVTLTVK